MRDTLNKLRYLLSRREQWQALGLFALMLGGAALEMLGVGSLPAFVAVLDNPDRLLQYAPIQAAYDALGITSHAEFILWSAGGWPSSSSSRTRTWRGWPTCAPATRTAAA